MAPPGVEMAKADADLNLLFGILALQMDFVSRDALIGAMHAWVLDKGEPLGRILRERGALAEAHFTLLDSMVAHHVAIHGGEPRRSLAAALAPRAVGDDLRAIANPDLHAAMSDVAAIDTSVSDPSATRTSEGNGRPSAAARFVLLRPLARGAIGQVSVALDRELNREVAFKEIQPARADDPASRGRFLLEAEVTGHLEHPGIVPVYSLGHDDFGRPFYAMRLIRGESLEEAITRFHRAEGSGRDPGERELQLRQLLVRFISVCDAVTYAHSRGVLHRDLKPSNIMLGPYGETLVVDWGLAKVVGRDHDARSRDDAETTLQPASASGSSETVAGSAVGTPAYMSPEQAAGKLDRLGPPSDFYSLGATLYDLLTGRAPFDGPDVLRKVERGEFPPPHAVHRAVPAALEAVCLKAMALRPEARYPSASAIARDIERWLAEEPVSAWSEPPALRARRWLRRHRTWLTAGAVAVVVALVALVATVTVQGRANRELRAANASEQRARRQAQARFALARDAIRTLHTGASEDLLLKEPQFEALRGKLLRTALDFYRKLQEVIEGSQDTDPAARADLADAYVAVATITAATGSKDEALAAFERARALYLELLHPDPRNTRLLIGLAEVLHKIGDVLNDTGRPAGSMQSFERAREVLAALVRDRPGMAQFEIELANMDRLIGMLQMDGSPAEAMRSCRRALSILRRLAVDHPDDPKVWDGLGAILNNISGLQRNAGEFERAMASYREALDIRNRLFAAYPERPGYRVALARSHRNIGLLLSQMGQPAAAIQSHRAGLEVQKALIRDLPTVTLYRFDLAKGLNHLGKLLRAHGPPDEAPATYHEARTFLRDLARTNPSDARFRTELARSLVGIAGIRRTAGDLAEALGSAQEALMILESPPGPGRDDYPIVVAAHSLCSALIGHDPSRPTPEEQAERRAHVEAALAALRREMSTVGPKTMEAYFNDPDLAPLRPNPESRRCCSTRNFRPTPSPFNRRFGSPSAVPPTPRQSPRGIGMGWVEPSRHGRASSMSTARFLDPIGKIGSVPDRRLARRDDATPPQSTEWRKSTRSPSSAPTAPSRAGCPATNHERSRSAWPRRSLRRSKGPRT